MSQTFHKFRAETFDAAYRKMVQTLGENAVVVNTTEITEGGVLGFMGTKMVELTASVKAAAAPARRPSLPEKKYQAAALGTDETVSDTVAYFRKLVEDAQERMAKNNAAKPDAAAPGAAAPGAEAKETSGGVVPFRKKQPAGEMAQLQRELREMREMLQVLMAENPASGLPAEFVSWYRLLIQAGVCRKLAANLIASIVGGSDISIIKNPRVFQERLKVEMQKRLSVTGGIKLTRGKRRVVALVGATGVGKTTNLAKLAAMFAVKERARVALITTDTYRVAAPEQLRVYANIIGLPMQVTNTPDELARALGMFKDCDLVLIDTAGGSQFNAGQIQELKTNLDAIAIDDVTLVLSANTQLDELRSAVENFSCLKPNSLLFSKLDETRRFGAMFSIAAEAGLPVGYFSIGQNVPDDIELASARTITRLIIENGGSSFGPGAKTAGVR